MGHFMDVVWYDLNGTPERVGSILNLTELPISVLLRFQGNEKEELKCVYLCRLTRFALGRSTVPLLLLGVQHIGSVCVCPAVGPY